MVKALLQQTNWQVLALGKGVNRLGMEHERLEYVSLDMTDGVAAFGYYLQARPNMIVHAAAKTQVDDCELDKPVCWDINVTATRFLVEAAKKLQANLIFLSTDFVFDGIAGPYDENDIPNPLSYYGSSKIAAEKEIINSGLAAAVVRTCLVYGPVVGGSRSHLLSWVKENLQKGNAIKVVTDQWRTPTYAADLAKGIVLLLQQKATGIYHISGAEMMTPYDMALAVAAHSGLPAELLQPLTAATFSQSAPRPAVTGFVLDKIKALGYQPTAFADALGDVLMC